MQGGDLSNETPRRAVVSVDCFLDREPIFKKVLGLVPYTSEEVTYNRAMLSRFWRYSNDNGLILELVGFGYSQKEMDEIMEDLDNLGTNPFRYAKAHRVVADLVAELPYRNELLCVIDIPTRALRYGSRYFDLGRV
ncbi:hypothetical protein UFOVP621_12 [uncultured Caudovirales phage]|uniref:Uncharacterized protein n=1 Tax=uncultured Caudovirales phage TaxID=2100421 RepID=A0A6J5N1F2_9CAUD|nr:hypothetical protein UFOVP621_12 [uncultured Caudovirales phage]